jgi:hypothetical protein
VSLTTKDQGARPRPLERKTLSEIMSWYWIVDGWLSMKLCIVCRSVIVLLTESSKTDLSLVKFVHDGFQNNSHESTSVTVWQSAKAYWTTIVARVALLFRRNVTGEDVSIIITFQKANAGVLTVNIWHRQLKGSSKLNHGRGKWRWQFSGMYKRQFWNTTKRMAQK